MTTRECYDALGGGYDEALGRMFSESLMTKFLKKFPADGTFSELKAHFLAHEDEAAFEAVHTLKGICLNLGLADLSRSVSALTEALRNGRKPEADGLMEQVEKDYDRAVSVIGQL
ncbi:MAG: Hpt domain-containing protein [Chordicoccus sp.]